MRLVHCSFMIEHKLSFSLSFKSIHNHLLSFALIVIAEFYAKPVHNLGYPAISMHDVGDSF